MTRRRAATRSRGGGTGFGFRSQTQVCFCGAKQCVHGEFTGEYQGTPSTFKLTPFSHEDALVVQGFPDDFEIGPSRVVARDGIGNAVPPPVMHRLLSFYGLEGRAAAEPAVKRRRT